MKEKYGVQIRGESRTLDQSINGESGDIYYKIVWYDTLEEAIKNANGEPIIKSVAYEVKEQE